MVSGADGVWWRCWWVVTMVGGGDLMVGSDGGG
jgi:hypothetical protein